MNTFRKVFALLSPKERRNGILVLLMMMLMALVETAGVASIMPFLAVLGRPDVIHNNSILSWTYVSLGFESDQSFLTALGILAVSIIIFGAIFCALTHYVMARYTHMRNHSLSTRMLKGYLRQPYEFFLSRNSADLSKSVLSEVTLVVNGVIVPGANFLAYSMVVVFVTGLLMFVDIWVAFSVGLVLGGTYCLIYGAVRGFLAHIGADRVAANLERFTAASEAFGGIKDIKLLGREKAYLQRYMPSSSRFARHQATNTVIGLTPKFLVEAVAFGGIMVVALYLLSSTQDLGHVLPVIGLYAFAGYRLIPAVQNMYAALSKFRFGLPALDVFYGDLQKAESIKYSTMDEQAIPELSDAITMNNVKYIYPGASFHALDGITLRIPAKTTVGFVGTTGSGKTTLIDLILGLLKPNSGTVLADEQILSSNNIKQWQKKLGYVPQNIYLADDTIAANIAFGIEKEKVDFQAVQRAAKIAAIHEFIETELPKGYNTVVGERGMRISGGQRQRIGIARALYHDPEILVLDEATSALDTVTEHAVMQAIYNLGGRKTILLIAHRLSTVQRCDIIYLLEHGCIVAKGNYEELIASNEQFRNMAGDVGFTHDDTEHQAFRQVQPVDV